MAAAWQLLAALAALVGAGAGDGDSYLNAYHLAHDLNEHVEPEYHAHYDVDLGADTQPPPTELASYGPPAVGHTYGPPVEVNYPKRITPGGYGPPHHQVPPLVTHKYYEPEPSLITGFLQNLLTPHAFFAILDKIKWFKVDLFTIGKLILKLFILKKILTFLTILFLLFVLPSLKHKGKGSKDEDGEDARMSGRTPNQAAAGLNALTAHVLTAIERLERRHAPPIVGATMPRRLRRESERGRGDQRDGRTRAD